MAPDYSREMEEILKELIAAHNRLIRAHDLAADLWHKETTSQEYKEADANKRKSIRDNVRPFTSIEAILLGQIFPPLETQISQARFHVTRWETNRAPIRGRVQ